MALFGTGLLNTYNIKPLALCYNLKLITIKKVKRDTCDVTSVCDVFNCAPKVQLEDAYEERKFYRHSVTVLLYLLTIIIVKGYQLNSSNRL